MGLLYHGSCALASHSVVWLLGGQVKRLLEVARGSRIEVMLRVALNTGMRRGELCGGLWICGNGAEDEV